MIGTAIEDLIYIKPDTMYVGTSTPSIEGEWFGVPEFLEMLKSEESKRVTPTGPDAETCVGMGCKFYSSGKPGLLRHVSKAPGANQFGITYDPTSPTKWRGVSDHGLYMDTKGNVRPTIPRGTKVKFKDRDPFYNMTLIANGKPSGQINDTEMTDQHIMRYFDFGRESDPPIDI